MQPSAANQRLRRRTLPRLRQIPVVLPQVFVIAVQRVGIAGEVKDLYGGPDGSGAESGYAAAAISRGSSASAST
jgi:hypothetical protein